MSFHKDKVMSLVLQNILLAPATETHTHTHTHTHIHNYHWSDKNRILAQTLHQCWNLKMT